MTEVQSIDAPAPFESPSAVVLNRFGGLSGHAFEAAVRYDALPAETPLSITLIRELIGVGTHIAGRVFRQLVASGFAAARRMRDVASGRLLGRRTDWIGPDRPRPPEPGPPAAVLPHDPALALLESLADADARLVFAEGDLRTLVPFVNERLADGETIESLRRLLTRNLPSDGRPIRSGLLHYRLTKTSKKRNTVPAQRTPDSPPRPHLVECAECGHPSPTLTPGTLCRECRPPSDPEPLTAADLGTLLEGCRRREPPTEPQF